jgi:hypothetical protein
MGGGFGRPLFLWRPFFARKRHRGDAPRAAETFDFARQIAMIAAS